MSAVIIDLNPKLAQKQAATAAARFVTAHGTDRCVICYRDTGIPSDTMVDYRPFYTEAGQCCRECALSVHNEP